MITGAVIQVMISGLDAAVQWWLVGNRSLGLWPYAVFCIVTKPSSVQQSTRNESVIPDFINKCVMSYIARG